MKENLKRPFQVQHTYWPNQVGMKSHYNYTKPASPFLLEVEQDFGLGRPLEIFQYLITLGLGHRRRAPFARRLGALQQTLIAYYHAESLTCLRFHS